MMIEQHYARAEPEAQSLNPYSNGMMIEPIKEREQEAKLMVLILILME